LKTKNISQKGKVVALLVVITTLAVAGLAGVNFLSESFVVAQGPGPSDYTSKSNEKVQAQGPGNDPITKNCFRITGGIYDMSMMGGGTVGVQNWNKTMQNFVSLLPKDKLLTLLNEKIAGGSGPINDMAAFWNAMQDDNMTRHSRLVGVSELNSLLAAAKPGFTKIQQDLLNRCITNEVNSLGPTSHF
jgi:hypothetical protein